MKALLLAALSALVLSTSAFAHPTGHGGDYDSTTTTTAPTATVIPDTYPGVVSALRERLTAAETALAAGKIVDVHRSCGAMKDLALATPAKALSLAAGAQATVGTTAVHLQQKVAELVSAADKGETTAAKAAISAIRADLDVLGGFVK